MQLPPRSRTPAQMERAAAMRAHSSRDVYNQPFGSLREAYNVRTYNSRERVASPSSSSRGSLSPPPVTSQEGRKSPLRATNSTDTQQLVTSRSSRPFLGPRPWGARHSEPNVTDVRTALAIHRAKEHSPSRYDASAAKQVAEDSREGDADATGARPTRRAWTKSLTLRAESMENLASPPPATNLRATNKRLAKSSENLFASMTSSSAAGARSESPTKMATSKRSLQQQYSELQGNFSRWQQQLSDNQALLNKTNTTSTSKTATPARAPANLECHRFGV